VKQHSNSNLNRVLVVVGSAVVAMLATACGASNASQIPIHTAGPAGLAVTSRSVTVKPHDMAYGRPVAFASAGASSRASVDIDQYLLPQPRAPRSNHPALPRPVTSQREQFAALPAQKQAEAPLANQESSGRDLETLMASAEPPQQSAADLDRYAQRDRQSSELQKYRGGDAVVITASTLIIILLVVLLLVLLT
jgi:hypothetical protein